MDILRYIETAPKKKTRWQTQLKELEADGSWRTVIPSTPIQVEYSVTEHGKTLFPILDAFLLGIWKRLCPPVY